jgi:hypothetical protein
MVVAWAELYKAVAAGRVSLDAVSNEHETSHQTFMRVYTTAVSATILDMGEGDGENEDAFPDELKFAMDRTRAFIRSVRDEEQARLHGNILT